MSPAAAWPVMPGVPAAGHVTARGYWHPGAADGCTKPGCAPRPPVAQRWCRYCQAGPGDPCMTADGAPTPRFHADRRRDW